MPTISKDTVRDALKVVMAPDGKTDIVTAGIVSEIVIAGGNVMFALNIDPDNAKAFEPVRIAAQQAAEAIDGVGKVMAAMTAEKKQSPATNGSTAPQAGVAVFPDVVVPALGDLPGGVFSIVAEAFDRREQRAEGNLELAVVGDLPASVVAVRPASGGTLIAGTTITVAQRFAIAYRAMEQLDRDAAASPESEATGGA